MPPSAQPEWYADGLRFECTLCGNCCTGPEGYVLVSDDECAAIAKRLDLSAARFKREYTHVLAGLGRSLNEVETEHGRDCIFLDRHTTPGKAVCSLYGARPTQCQTFPWWPENLRSRAAWERTAKHCEGINRGALVRVEDIRIERNRQEAATAAAAASAPV